MCYYGPGEREGRKQTAERNVNALRAVELDAATSKYLRRRNAALPAAAWKELQAGKHQSLTSVLLMVAFMGFFFFFFHGL